MSRHEGIQREERRWRAIIVENGEPMIDTEKEKEYEKYMLRMKDGRKIKMKAKKRPSGRT